MAFSPKYALFEITQSVMNWTAFSLTSPDSAAICSCRIAAAIFFALSHDSWLIAIFFSLSFPSFSSGSGVSWSLKNQVSIMASARATALIPATWLPLFPFAMLIT